MRKGGVESMAIAGGLLLVVVLVMAKGAVAQLPQCLQALTPCAQFLSGGNPSALCCNAMNVTVRTQLPCLCSVLGNKDLINQPGVNVTQALSLPQKCGLTADPSLCATVKSGADAPSQHTPAPTAGNGVPDLASSVGPALTGLLLLLWALAMA